MTISTVLSKASRRGFTLAEVLVSMALAGIVIAASTGSLMFMAKSTAGMGNYQDMNSSSRYSLEQFGTDARMTVDVKAAATDFVALDTWAGTGVTTRIEYVFNAAAGTLTRQVKNSGGAVIESRVFLRDVSDLALIYYQVDRSETTSLASIKEIQLQATMRRRALNVGNTNEIISARFMMRNRAVGE